MKKVHLLLFAIVASVIVTLSMSSCSDNDVETGNYPFKVIVNGGSLSEQYAYGLRLVEKDTVLTTDKEAAIAIFDWKIASIEKEMQLRVDQFAEETKVYDFSVVFQLLDTNREVLRQRVFAPSVPSDK